MTNVFAERDKEFTPRISTTLTSQKKNTKSQPRTLLGAGIVHFRLSGTGFSLRAPHGSPFSTALELEHRHILQFSSVSLRPNAVVPSRPNRKKPRSDKHVLSGYGSRINFSCCSAWAWQAEPGAPPLSFPV